MPLLQILFAVSKESRIGVLIKSTIKFIININFIKSISSDNNIDIADLLRESSLLSSL
jgi:hypothetical protein